MKFCSKCNTQKSHDHFYIKNKITNKLSSQCKKCIIKSSTEAMNKDPIRKKEKMLKYFYGISMDDYNKQFELQNGVCHICNENKYNIALCVDHCHETGKVRGLLCHGCNHVLGLFKDDANAFYQAIDYIQSQGVWFEDRKVLKTIKR